MLSASLSSSSCSLNCSCVCERRCCNRQMNEREKDKDGWETEVNVIKNFVKFTCATTAEMALSANWRLVWCVWASCRSSKIRARNKLAPGSMLSAISNNSLHKLIFRLKSVSQISAIKNANYKEKIVLTLSRRDFRHANTHTHHPTESHWRCHIIVSMHILSAAQMYSSRVIWLPFEFPTSHHSSWHHSVSPDSSTSPRTAQNHTATALVNSRWQTVADSQWVDSFRHPFGTSNWHTTSRPYYSTGRSISIWMRCTVDKPWTQWMFRIRLDRCIAGTCNWTACSDASENVVVLCFAVLGHMLLRWCPPWWCPLCSQHEKATNKTFNILPIYICRVEGNALFTRCSYDHLHRIVKHVIRIWNTVMRHHRCHCIKCSDFTTFITKPHLKCVCVQNWGGSQNCSLIEFIKRQNCLEKCN